MSEFTHTVGAVTLGLPFMLRGRPKVRAGIERLASRRLGALAKPRIDVRSRHFSEGGAIPHRFSAQGENLNPELAWDLVPLGTKSLALMVEDPDAPTPRPFVHWLLAELPPSMMEIPPGLDPGGDGQGVQGRSSMLNVGWTGCAPPVHDLPHHYHFQLFALDRRLGLQQGFGRKDLCERMRGHILAFGELVGTYRR